jgi:hypothetical protein
MTEFMFHPHVPNSYNCNRLHLFYFTHFSVADVGSPIDLNLYKEIYANERRARKTILNGTRRSRTDEPHHEEPVAE